MGANAVTEKAVPMRNQQLSKIEDPTQRNQKYSTAGIEYGEMAADRKHNAKTAQKVSLVNTLGRRTRGGKGACVCVCVLRTRLFELQGQCQPNAKLYWRSLSESCMATWKNENGEKLKEAACKSWICHGSFSRAWVRKHVQEFSH